MQSMLLQLAEGMATSVAIFVLTLLFSLPLGVLVALARMSKSRLLSGLMRIYISIMRGTPLMLQLLVVFFGPYYLLRVNLGSGYRFPAVILAFVINYAAYFAEIYRGGIQSIDRGQYEAAQVLGYSRGQTFFRIILPQVVRRILPSVTNEVITLVKDTSLASVIGTVEMFTRARMIVAAPRSPGMLTYLAAGVFYYVFNAVVAYGMTALEKRMDHGK